MSETFITGADVKYSDGTIASFSGPSQDAAFDLTTVPLESPIETSRDAAATEQAAQAEAAPVADVPAEPVVETSGETVAAPAADTPGEDAASVAG